MNSPFHPRHLALLDTLARAPFLCAEDLTRELGLSRSQGAADLRLLEQQRALAHLSRPAGPARSRPTHLYFLRPAGLAALRREQEAADASLPWWGTRDRRLLALLPRLDRLLVGHAVVRALLTPAPRILGEQGRAARVGWTWIRDYQQSLPALAHGPFTQAARLFADWLLVLRVRQEGARGEQVYPLVLLLDHACLPQQQIRARLQRLVHARALAADAPFPLVLILLPGWQRARHWQRLAAELTRETEHPLRGCLTVVPTGARDGWRLPWQPLYGSGPGENPRALLVPSPPEACPAAWLGRSHHGLSVREARLAEDGAPGPRKRSLTHHLVRQLTAARTPREPRLVGLALERTHYRVLELLGVAPLLTLAEIAAFLELRETSAQQYLAEMQGFHCLETECLGEETTRRFRLSSQGLHLLARRHHLPPRSLARRQEGPEASSRQKGLDTLRRTATLTRGVYAFFARLSREAALHGHRLLWWETALAREHASSSPARAAWRGETPHGMGAYQAGAQTVRFWLEWHGDGGTASSRLRTLSAVLAGYAAYVRSRAWSREGQVRPVLLLVCPDAAREQRIGELAREHLGRLSPGPIVLSTTLDQLNSAGPLAPIWRSVLLPVGEPERNRQVFYERRAEEEWA